MKTIPLITVFLCFPGCAVFADDTATKSAEKNDAMLFANKDLLHGTFAGCDKAGLHWQSTAAKEPMVFQTTSLAEMKLAPRMLPAGATPGTHLVRLINGDELPGVPVSLDDKALLLDTWYAGRLTIPRGMVTGITKLKKEGVIYQGPNNPKEWIIDEDGERDENGHVMAGWAVKNGALVATGYGDIRCAVKLPPRVDIGFDLTLPAGEPDLDIFLFGEDTGDDRNCYLFQVGLGGVDIHRISNGNSQQLSGETDTDDSVFRQEKVRLDIRADRDAKKLWLFVNGKKTWEYTDQGDFAGKGATLKLTAQIEQGAMKMRNIKISTWEGEASDGVGSDTGPRKPSKEDRLLMENQDQVSGKLNLIANGKVAFDSGHAGLNVGLDRIVEIDFAAGKNAPDKTPGSVRAYFAGGGNATLEFESWDGKQVVATNPVFGKALFSPAVFQRLQFQPGAKAQSEDAPVAAGGDAPRDDITSAETPDPLAADTLRFANKDVLHGTLLAYSGAGVRWQSPAAKEPFVFQMAAVADVKLGVRKQPGNAMAQPACLAQMANGDEIPGALVSLDDNNLLLDTWYAGRLTIPRASVKGISTLKDHKTFFYQGPGGMDGWTVSLCNPEDEDGKPVKRKADWQYRNGAFISTGFDELERAIEMPARCSIEFDLDMPSAAFSDSRPELELQIGDYKAGYLLDFYNEEDHVAEDKDVNKNKFMLRRMPDKGNGRIGGEVEVNGSGARREKTQVDLRIDKEAKSLWLFINGKLVKQWVDNNGFAGTGNLLTFCTMDDEKSYTKLSNIKLSEWNGKLDVRPEAAPRSARQDGVTMENQDNLSGRIKKIADGKIILATAYSDIAVPLDHVTQINLASTAASPTKTQTGESFRAMLAGGGSVALKLESWREKQVAVSSPDFGNAVFAPDVFQRLQFNLNKKPLPDEDAGDEDRDE